MSENPPSSSKAPAIPSPTSSKRKNPTLEEKLSKTISEVQYR
jgi:hypothetical protein